MRYLSFSFFIGWCNKCIEGLPPFQEGQSRISSSLYEWLIPAYRFTSQGDITEWKIYVNKVARLELQVWQRKPQRSQQCLERSRVDRSYCKIGANEVPRSVLQVRNGVCRYRVPTSRQISVNEGDIVGLYVATLSNDSGIQFSSNFNVTVLVNLGSTLGLAPAPILMATISK